MALTQGTALGVGAPGGWHGGAGASGAHSQGGPETGVGAPGGWHGGAGASGAHSQGDPETGVGAPGGWHGGTISMAEERDIDSSKTGVGTRIKVLVCSCLSLYICRFAF